MAETYKTKYGLDFPVEFSDIMIDLTLAKKWRLYQRLGFDVSGFSPGDCLERSIRALWPETVKMSPWTLSIIHDFAENDKYAMIGCGSCGKSYAMAACGILYWITDPVNTAVVVGSATLKDLATRAWSPTLSLFSELKNNRAGLVVPGRIRDNMYAITNEKDTNFADASAPKCAIQGRAMEEGRVQGLHTEWVLFIVDELALIRDVESLKTSYANTRIGTLGWKCMTAANPDAWDSPNSCFYLPASGEEISPDTGTWTSRMGYFVRHFDGLKSPVVKDPALKASFPFLMSQEDVDEVLTLCNGDANHPRFWKMVRGFPLRTSLDAQTVLDPLVAAQSCALEPPVPPRTGNRERIGLVAGVDPAWSEAGDDAIYAGCEVFYQDERVVLDFSGRVSRLPITTKAAHGAPLTPVTKQLRDGVLARVQNDGGPRMHLVYVDCSGNQGLADDLDIYVGAGCGHVNSSARASDTPLRALDGRPACSHVHDRGAEAWMVLAEFVRAGQVRGLPQRALDALVQRRFQCRAKSSDPLFPFRLEPKDDFIRRFHGSPNDCDACALAALAAKERLGAVPFGGRPAPQLDGALPQAPGMPVSEYTGLDWAELAPPDSSDSCGADGVGCFDAY